MHVPQEEPDNRSTTAAEGRILQVHRVALTVPGLCRCEGADNVGRVLNTVRGVCGCEADVPTRSVHVAYDGARCALVDLIAAVQRVGYQVDDVHISRADGSAL